MRKERFRTLFVPFYRPRSAPLLDHHHGIETRILQQKMYVFLLKDLSGYQFPSLKTTFFFDIFFLEIRFLYYSKDKVECQSVSIGAHYADQFFGQNFIFWLIVRSSPTRQPLHLLQQNQQRCINFSKAPCNLPPKTNCSGCFTNRPLITDQ